MKVITSFTAKILFMIAALFISHSAMAQWTRTGNKISPTTVTDSVGIGIAAPTGKFQVAENGRDYFVNRSILTSTGSGSTENSLGVNYILLHKLYDSLPYMAEHHVMGKITGTRGAVNGWNRKFTVEVNTSTAYNENKASMISYHEGTSLVKVRYNGERYLALSIGNNSDMSRFSFTGYAANPALMIVYDQDIDSVAPFTHDYHGAPAAAYVMETTGIPNPVSLGSTLNVNGNTQLGGRLIFETGGNPGLYTGTASGELSRYFQLVNSTATTSAAGLKAGGVLVSDDYAYANPSKTDLIVKGKIALGTASPSSEKLTIGAGGKIRLQDSLNSYNNLLYGRMMSANNRSGTFMESNASINYGLNGVAASGFVFRWLAKNNSAIDYFTDTDELMRLSMDGKLALGATSGTEKLTLNGNIDMAGVSGRRIYMGNTGGTFGLAFNASNPNYGIFYTEGTPDNISLSPNGNATNGVLNIYGDNKVAIGTNCVPSGYMLSVKGKIICEELKVKLEGSNCWADHVFNKEYKLMSLQELDKYIAKNKHLPNIPSAAQVNADGVAVNEMLIKQMEKIEELTLYLLQLSKENEALRKRVDVIEAGK